MPKHHTCTCIYPYDPTCVTYIQENAFTLCQENCSSAPQMLPLMPTLPAPTAEPTLMRISDDGVYSITLSNVTDSGNEAGGSGDTGSDVMTGDGQSHVVYLVRVRHFNNDTFFPVVSCARKNT